MSNPLRLSIELSGYQREQTDCRLCSECEEMILTDMYHFVFEIDGERIVSENTVLCEKCYELVKDK